MHKQLKIAICSFCGVALLGGIILFAIAFSVVEATEWGLVYDTFNKDLDPKPTSSTRALIGIANSYLTFSRIAVNVEFSAQDGAQSHTVEGWTQDGLNVYLDLTFQFFLRPERLRDIYLEYGPHWYAAVVRMMYSRIKETTVYFRTTDYFENRDDIAQKLTEVFSETFMVDFDNMMYLYDLQLIDIDFEDSFESIIIDKLNEAQSIETLRIKQRVNIINKEIELIQAEANNKMRTEFAKAAADGLVATQEAEGNAIFTLFNETTLAYNDLLVSPTNNELLQVIYASELPYMDANNIYVNSRNVLFT